MNDRPRLTLATRDVLQALAQSDETWGLSVVRSSGRPTGTVYPILQRLETYGWVDSRWDDAPRPGPRRRLYRLTDVGRLQVEEMRDASDSAEPANPRIQGFATVAGVA